MVKEVLENLNPTDKATLMYAFNNEFSQEIPLKDGSFIGVNIYNTTGIEIIDEVNTWLHGRRT